ncbi:Glycerophosphoryl diester phosphodiesterase [Rubrivivax sp. A210]|uniref:glycerophosphodiester phosphodiesterase n=1 Tax=Rubrivivax sp. A210 TaxID=2772301 RepID=UPI001918F3E0|nr:glycerophosphodiester phosphodiesterase family protein [Rubrivivax sp. A210]CAD5374529.1 Glycerophosphoryl diester phosphodiesterase [Rubrivivax sp. A210]
MTRSTGRLASRRIAALHAAVGAAQLNIGHRGARAYAPENSLPAFEKAARLGCQMVECDVHVSRDGQLVVHHDDDLRRCTDAAQRWPQAATHFISDHSLAEIQALDAGRWFTDELALAAPRRQAFLQSITAAERAAHISPADEAFYASGRVHVPSLDELLQLAEACGLLLNIEIKSLPRLYPGIAGAVMARVAHHGLAGRVLVSSFDHEQLLAVRVLDQGVATAVLAGERLARIGRYLALLDADAYHPGCYGGFDSLGFGSVAGEIDAAALAALVDEGLAVNVWTCNDPLQMRVLRDGGVSGIITDYPDRVAAVLAGTDSPSTV